MKAIIVNINTDDNVYKDVCDTIIIINLSMKTSREDASNYEIIYDYRQTH